MTTKDIRVNGAEESHILVFCMCWTGLTTFTHVTLHRSVAGDHFHHVSACCVCLHAASSGKQSFDPSHFYSRLCPGQRPAGLVILSPLPPHSCSPLSTRTTSFFSSFERGLQPAHNTTDVSTRLSNTFLLKVGFKLFSSFRLCLFFCSLFFTVGVFRSLTVFCFGQARWLLES